MPLLPWNGRAAQSQMNMKRINLTMLLAVATLLLGACDAASRRAGSILQEQVAGDSEGREEDGDESDEDESEDEENEPDEDENGPGGDNGQTDDAGGPRTVEEAVNRRIEEERSRVREHVDRALQDAHERAGQALDKALGGGER